MPFWQRPEIVSLIIAFLILVSTVLSARTSWEQFLASRIEGTRNRAVLDALEAVISSVKDAETGQRGYLLTNDNRYLAPYDRAAANLPGQLQLLRDLDTRDNSNPANIANLESLISRKLAEISETVRLARSGQRQAAIAVVNGDHGQALMEQIRSASDRIAVERNARLARQIQDITASTTRAFWITIAGDLTLVLIIVLGTIAIHRASKRREELIDALAEDERRMRELRDRAAEAEERTRNILESITDGFVSFDKDWNITWCNAEAERLFGRPKADLLGKNYWLEFQDQTGDQIERNLRHAAEERKPASFETHFSERNAWWEYNAYPARDGGLSVYFRDITVRKRMEERTRHSQKLESMGILAGGIAHDFNNLLTAILGGASLVLEEAPPGTAMAGHLRNVVNASERAAQLTRQMLAYSGRGRFIVEPIDLSQQVREIAALLEASVPRNVELILNLAPEGMIIEADSGQIQQLVMNLVINAAEAVGSASGTVAVSTRGQDLDEGYVRENLSGDQIEPGRYVLLEVHDTGKGMDDATMNRIFDPFFTTKFTGRGLGLAAVLGIVRGHKGVIRVYSNPGQGTTFKVFLPVAAHAAGPKEQLPEIDFHGKGTILVVDDEMVVQKLASSTLEFYGYRVLVASNGQEAVEMFLEQPDEISLVLLDMTMPVLSGEETLRRLKQIRPHVPVIASSGYNEIEALRRFGTGVRGFLQKPYRAAQLAEKVKRAISHQPSAIS